MFSFDTKTFDLNKNQAALRVRIKNNTLRTNTKNKS